MAKRAVLYSRVSGDDRGNESRNLNGQIEMCREFAQARGYEIVAELAEDDRGASGATFELPQLSRILEMARDGCFDVLVVRELDRLSRRLAKQLVVEEDLKRHGVDIEYVLGDYEATPEGNLMKNVRAVIAEYERVKISERMARGRNQLARSGSVLVCGRPPYGYRLVKAHGKSVLEPCEPEASVVRQIFDWYTTGNGDGKPLSLDGIARRLGAMGVPSYAETGTRVGGRQKTRTNPEWSRSTIHRLLKSETYIGVWRYGPNGIPVPVPAVVARDAWEAAQEKRVENRRSGGQQPIREYLLRRRITCGVCGKKMASAGPSYYGCPGSGSRGYEFKSACDSTSFDARVVDAAVWEWVEALLADPAALARGLREHQLQREEANEPARRRLQLTEDLLADNRKQLERLLDLYLSGGFDKDILSDRKARLEMTIKALDKERSELTAQLEAELLTDDQIAALEGFAIKTWQGLVAAEHNFEARRAVVDALDVRATLSREDGKIVASVQCILGGDSLRVRRIPLLV